MSCCGGKCNCGSSCDCGSGSGGCKMYPDMSLDEKMKVARNLVLGVGPEKVHIDDAGDMDVMSENGGCNCGNNCACNPCKCGK